MNSFLGFGLSPIRRSLWNRAIAKLGLFRYSSQSMAGPPSPSKRSPLGDFFLSKNIAQFARKYFCFPVAHSASQLAESCWKPSNRRSSGCCAEGISLLDLSLNSLEFRIASSLERAFAVQIAA
jgi:hypothetical protein